MRREFEPSGPGDPDADAITAEEMAAAEWLIARDRGLSPEQQAHFERWLKADPRHAELYAEMDQTWAQLDRVGEPPPVATRSPLRSTRWAWIGAGLAAAAAITMVVLPRRGAIAGGQGACAMAWTTPVGGSRPVALPDGSAIRLNTDTALSVAFSGAERRVQLAHGEAFFQVAKDSSRPFIVTTGEVAVRAVGTEFDVRRGPVSVTVMVTEGKVRVSDASRGTTLLPMQGSSAEPPVLAAGQRVVIPIAGAGSPTLGRPENVVHEEVEQALAWQSGRLEFVDAPLSIIVDEFNRYNRHKLVVADQALSARRFGGTFGTGDFDAFVRVLETQFGVVAERHESETVLRPR